MHMVNASNTSNDKQSEPTAENKSGSPNSSPRSSPRPSPRPQTIRDHSRSDTHLTVNYKEPVPSTQKHDHSPSQDSSTSRSSSYIETTSNDLNRSESSGAVSCKDKKESRTKKKSAWYNVLYPTYKSRSEDFKRIFKDVPDEERLVVDYSCALQKEILVHGRLYVSQDYLCFYANIFGWETNVTVKWRDISAITKEKTALVIPNAILLCTKTDKYFFTSFAARDKTFLMLFRIWQNALLDQPMSSHEMWHWVHQCYGEELGLTSDDDDYVQPGTEEDKLSGRLSVDSFIEESVVNTNEVSVMEQMVLDNKHDDEILPPLSSVILNNNSADASLPTDQSDSTDSDGDKPKFHSSPTCTATHEGKQLLNNVIPIHIDQLFTLLFTSSKFYLDFHASRKTTDLIQSAWTHNPENNTKTRVVNLTVALTQSVGPKCAQVTETQIMLPCSKAGLLYAIDVETVNGGIPYGDSFCILIHYCLQRLSEKQTSLSFYAQIKYKKSVWGLVKGFIEKNCWQGLEDFCSSLCKALHAECDETVSTTIKRKSRHRRRINRPEKELPHGAIGPSKAKASSGVFSSDFATIIVFAILILLVFLNVMLYYKLWSLEEAPPYTFLDLHILKDPPKSHDEWIKLLQKQETLHTVEMQRWQRVLKTSIQLLKQIEEQLNELQHSIHPTYTNKIMSIIQNHKDVINKAQEEL